MSGPEPGTSGLGPWNRAAKSSAGTWLTTGRPNGVPRYVPVCSLTKA